ncbi:MAG: recombinase family protein [Ruminococcaceae bacterium]|nr:recombinase family protein [Oscillospiraceae bacterium]
MMRKITEIPATISIQSQDINKQYRVAAYCRVSTDKEEQENSLENQITYYKSKIENTSNWTLVDIFADFGISGMNDTNRIEFQRMLEMCNKGKIDLIITKSISRFARNTVDCLTHVRKLKAKNIGVIFEKEGINTLDAVSETFLTWFSAFAQAESESLSQNITRGKRMGYKEGKFSFPSGLYGYDRGDGITPVIIPEQAAIVRKIFHMYLEGNSIRGIKKWLNDNNVETAKSIGEWSESTVSGILRNEKYKGDVLLQKSYTVDYLTKTMAKNKGEVTQYYIENNHDGIVSREIFDMVQDELQRRASLYSSKNPSRYNSKYALSGKVICGECGAKYRRVTWSRNGNKTIVWRCTERLKNGTKNCKNSPTIYEEDLHNAILNKLKEISPKSDDIAKKVKNEIESVVKKEDGNPQVLQRKIQNYEKEIEVLKNILKDAQDKEYYINKIRYIRNELLKLKEYKKTTISNCINTLQRENIQIIDDISFYTIVRKLIKQVNVVQNDKYKIVFMDELNV